MSLLAATIGLDKPAVVALVGSTQLVDQYAQNTDANITKSLDAATDAFRSAAIKGGYAPGSVDGLASSTTPESVKRWILHLALDELTSGGMGRPDSIAAFGTEARKWLSRLAGGAETVDGLSRASTTGGASARVGAPTNGNTFDRDNTNSPYGWRVRNY